MYLTREVFNISLVIMIFVAIGISQVNTKEKIIQNNLDKAEIEKWLVSYTNTIFVEMNPRGSFDKFVFSRKLTKSEYEMGAEGINTSEKKVPKGYSKRYMRLNFERFFYELFFSMGTKKFIETFDQADFNNDEFTTIKNAEYPDLLATEVVKNGISRKGFIRFFKEDNKSITKRQIFHMEWAFDDVLTAIKAKINKSNYDENVKQIQNMWEIRDNIKNPKYSLVINRWAGSYIIGKKNGKIQILDFAGGN